MEEPHRKESLMENAVLKTEKLSHVYSMGTPFEMTAIKDVDLEVRKGEFIGIIGHTGSGKSTLIQHLNGLIKPTSGTVYFKGEDINSSKKLIKEVRSRVGLVFQYPEYQLFEETVYKDIAFGPSNMGLDKDEIDTRVRNAARFVGISDSLLEKSPFDMSGGQKRRIAIAGIIAMNPEVLILDEPLAGLDPAGCDGIIENIKNYHDETGAAIIMVTHNMESVAKSTDRMIVLDHGTIALDGRPDDVFENGDVLRKMGLEVPAMTRVAEKLRDMGLPLEGSVYTVEQAKKAILALERGRSDC